MINLNNTAPIIEIFNYIVLDVDKTIAENGKSIPDEILHKTACLIEYLNIAIITSRPLSEDLERFAKSLHQYLKKSNKTTTNKFYIFPTTGSQGHILDFNSGDLRILYDKSRDIGYQRFRKKFQDDFRSLEITEVEDVHYDEKEEERYVQIKDCIFQVTFFFSHIQLRDKYKSELPEEEVNSIPHARNVLHVLPAGIDKKYAIKYLLEKDNDGKFLIIADGFYSDPNSSKQGNDLSFTELSNENTICINVGRNPPEEGSGVWYYPSSVKIELTLTLSLLDKIISRCSFASLKLSKAISHNERQDLEKTQNNFHV